MELARCTLDDKVYNAVDFSILSDLSTKRRNLICDECKNPAYFKKAAKSGQAACFGARPHKDSCSVASEEGGAVVGRLDDDEKELINSGNEIRVDFEFGSKLNTHILDGEDNESKFSKIGSSHSSANGFGNTKSSRRLKSLLNMLICDSSFAESNTKIDIGYPHPYNARTIFRKFINLSDDDVDKVKGLYGQIFDVQQSYGKKLWINSGSISDCSIFVPESLGDSFFERFQKYKDDTEELCGKYVLYFGRIKKSEAGKFYIKLDDTSKISFK